MCRPCARGGSHLTDTIDAAVQRWRVHLCSHGRTAAAPGGAQQSELVRAGGASCGGVGRGGRRRTLHSPKDRLAFRAGVRRGCKRAADRLVSRCARKKTGKKGAPRTAASATARQKNHQKGSARTKREVKPGGAARLQRFKPCSRPKPHRALTEGQGDGDVRFETGYNEWGRAGLTLSVSEEPARPCGGLESVEPLEQLG